MPKVLMLAYHYPPLGGVAVMRVLRFSKYLSQHGWQAVVLCVEGGAKHEPRDSGLLEEVPPEVLVERVPCLEPDNFSDSWELPREKIVRNLFKTFDKILFPDDRALWIKPLTRKALTLIKKHDIKVLWATAQPWSTLVAARNLKRSTGLPLVLDFRDDWTTSNADFRKTKRLAKEQALEQSVLAAADAVVSVTPQIVEELRKRAPKGIGPEQFHYIPNGFDPAHFKAPSQSQGKTFTIVHTGGLYHLRPISPLLEVLDIWFSEHPERVALTKIVLAGKISQEVSQEIASSPWKACFEILGFAEHHKVRRLISSASVNLLMIERVKTAAWLFTGKVFEYIGARKPILMLGPDPSPLAEILRDTGLGNICSYDLPEETARTLERLFQERGSETSNLREEHVERFNAYQQTGRLAQIFEEVTGHGKIS